MSNIRGFKCHYLSLSLRFLRRGFPSSFSHKQTTNNKQPKRTKEGDSILSNNKAVVPCLFRFIHFQFIHKNGISQNYNEWPHKRRFQFSKLLLLHLHLYNENEKGRQTTQQPTKKWRPHRNNNKSRQWRLQHRWRYHHNQILHSNRYWQVFGVNHHRMYHCWHYIFHQDQHHVLLIITTKNKSKRCSKGNNNNKQVPIPIPVHGTSRNVYSILSTFLLFRRRRIRIILPLLKLKKKKSKKKKCSYKMKTS